MNRWRFRESQSVDLDTKRNYFKIPRNMVQAVSADVHVPRINEDLTSICYHEVYSHQCNEHMINILIKLIINF